VDIHNSLEIIDTLTEFAAATQAAKNDGHVTWWDAPKFLALVPSARKALDDSEQIALELADLNDLEAKILVSRLLKLVTLLTGVALPLPSAP
jgi:hypothetical protein